MKRRVFCASSVKHDEDMNVGNKGGMADEVGTEEEVQVEKEMLTFEPVELRQGEEEVERMKRYLKSIRREISSAEARKSAGPLLLTGKGSEFALIPDSYLESLKNKLKRVKGTIRPLRKRKKSIQKGIMSAEGSGDEIMLQGFNWDSWKHDWYSTLAAQVDEIADAGFSVIWLPPPTESVSPEGYMPRDLYCLNSKYGNHDELVGLVQMLQDRGMKVLGDAVLNHRCAHKQNEQGVWNQFGGFMSWDARAIVKDDPNFHGQGNFGSGDHFTAAPNIDHSQDFVKKDIGEWLCWLRTEVGFDGWRLDFVKGFHGSHVKDYLEVSEPTFAVGEYWDALSYDWDGTPNLNQDAHRQRTVDWINAAGGLSTAFDITTKGILHAVFERCEYWRLKDAKGNPPGLLGWWPSRSVTFLENHDTGSSQGHWRFPHHGLEQGYAYLLTHPGTPCVFYDHMFHEQHLSHVIRRLIALRKECNIHCRSEIKILEASHDVYAAKIDDILIVKLGPGEFSPSPGSFNIVDRGNAWAVWKKSSS